MAWIVNVFNDSKGNIRSARLLLSASDESDNSTPYLKKQLNKLVVLDENEHWKCVFQEIYGREWICEFDSPSKNQFFALRCCFVSSWGKPFVKEFGLMANKLVKAMESKFGFMFKFSML